MLSNAFAELGEEYYLEDLNRWYGDRAMGLVTDDFINTILSRVPLKFIDDSLTNPGLLVGGHRRP